MTTIWQQDKWNKLIQRLELELTFLTKKNGTQLLCIDHRALNDITMQDVYLIPRIYKIINKFAKSKYFSKIDLQQEYRQIRIHPGDVKKPAFQSKFGTFHFLVMPFLHCNAPATFQRTMNFILQDHKNTQVFIDDTSQKTLMFQETHDEKVYAKTIQI